MNEYMVIVCCTDVELETTIAGHLKEGWECQGGVSIAAAGITTGRDGDCSTDMELRLAQAMVRELS